MLGRDELKKAGAGASRRLLLLSDGQLNPGIVEPAAVRQVAAAGLEQVGIRTSCLGFGPNYNRDLMTTMAQVTFEQLVRIQAMLEKLMKALGKIQTVQFIKENGRGGEI